MTRPFAAAQTSPRFVLLFSSSKYAVKHPSIRKGVKLTESSLPQTIVWSMNINPWEPSPLLAQREKTGDDLVESVTDIFGLSSEREADSEVINNEKASATNNRYAVQYGLVTLPMWVVGPCLLLITGIAPTLWLPLSSIYVGPNIASLLSFIGLDCIFNLGATLFLLMADSCARPRKLELISVRTPPNSYKFWNMLASACGFIIPLLTLLCSQKGVVRPQLEFISYAVMMGPYMLLLSIQIVTEMLTIHWKSPVWLVTPLIYEAYRVLQLMRGLKLGSELAAPTWIMHITRGMICWWILVISVQIMTVAWFVGNAASPGCNKNVINESNE